MVLKSQLKPEQSTVIYGVLIKMALTILFNISLKSKCVTHKA